jgi:L-iditol 2-dehydrogenase
VAGVIESVGPGVENVRPGDRVVASHHVPCMTCRRCLAGNDTVCETLRTTSFDPGGFAEFVRLPTINVDRGVYPIPDGMSFEVASFAEPLACAVSAQRLAAMRPGHSVLVLGAGLAGLMHVAAAPASGAGFVAATDLAAPRLDAARRLGAAAALTPDRDLPARLRERLGGGLADLVVVCTAAPAAFTQALACVEPGGTVLLFALPDPGTAFAMDMHSLWKSGVRIMSSYAGNRADHLAAIEMLRSGRVDAASLITHRLPLDRAAEGFRLVAAGGATLKVIVLPHGPS